MPASVGELFNSLQSKVPDLKAAILVHAAGTFDIQTADGVEFDSESFAAEYAALFRIARRTADDTAMGDLFEQILISDKALVVSRRIGAEEFAIFVFGADQQLGKLRYEISLLTRLDQ